MATWHKLFCLSGDERLSKKSELDYSHFSSPNQLHPLHQFLFISTVTKLDQVLVNFPLLYQLSLQTPISNLTPLSYYAPPQT